MYVICLYVLWPVFIMGQSLSVGENQDIEARHKKIRQIDVVRAKNNNVKEAPPFSSTLSVPLSEPKLLDRSNLPVFIVGTVDIRGATVLDGDARRQLLLRYEARILNINDINQLIADISNWYLLRGYVTTRAYIVPQNLMDGVLVVQVIEGRVSELKYNGLSNYHGLRYVFPGLKENLLQLRDLEQGIEQMNRLQSSNVRMSLRPSATTGESTVILKNTLARPSQVRFSYDTYSYDTLSVYPQNIDIRYDNFLGLQDSIQIGVSQFNGGGGQNNHNLSFSGSVPYGYYLAHLNYDKFDYTHFYTGRYGQFVYSGSSRKVGAKMSRVVDRNSTGKTTVLFGATVWDYKGVTNHVVSPALTYRLVTFRYGISQLRKDRYGVWHSGITFVHGLSRFGAKQNVSEVDAPKSQFFKVLLDVSRNGSFSFLGGRWSYLSSFKGQYTEETLYSSQKINLGGAYTVRGFNTSEIVGDKGGYFRNEIVRSVGDVLLNSSILHKLNVFTALDAGYVTSKIGLSANNGQGKGALFGLGFGLRGYFKSLQFEWTMARSLRAPTFVEREGWINGVSITLIL